ncbi:MAG: glycosyltransferase family 4 protein, partial [Rhodospirillales bacterium]
EHANARASLSTQHKLDPDSPILVTVAMMRDDAKLQSYEVLGEALKLLGAPWQLVVVGDGSARNKVEGYLGRERVTYLGELPETEIAVVLAASDIFVWPAINEAYGMAMLEAQSMGLPVVAGRTGGVADIIRDQETGLLSEVGIAPDFADKVDHLLNNQAERNAMSEKAIQIIRVEHSIETAAEILDRTLEGLIK